MLGGGQALLSTLRGVACRASPARAAAAAPIVRWFAKPSGGQDPEVLEALQGRREGDPKRGDYRGIVDAKGGVMHYLRHGGSLKRVNAPLVEPPASRHMVPFDLPNPNVDKVSLIPLPTHTNLTQMHASWHPTAERALLVPLDCMHVATHAYGTCRCRGEVRGTITSGMAWAHA